ncbi:MAG: hypothetical protein E7058_03800 [Lentisphaerae bacterium]|nr:hypothetical protein [Lentisphaerota bacterium]
MSSIIRKLGTVDCDIVEANPVVWQGKLLRFEYIRSRQGHNGYYNNRLGDSYFRFVDQETGEYSAPFGIGLHMGNAFVWEDRMIVTAVENWGKSRFYQLESTDLVNWTTPRVILEDPSWAGYNTSVCRADDRFVMVFELGKPDEIVGEPFTMFFAESTDLVNWHWIKDASFGKDFYTGGPMIRYFDGYFYMFYLGGSYEQGFRTCVARSTDLKNWTISSKNPVLDYGDEDRKLMVPFNHELTRHIASAENINASDLDMCEYNGKLELIYSWGCQRGIEFLARAQSDLTEKSFCSYFFS